MVSVNQSAKVKVWSDSYLQVSPHLSASLVFEVLIVQGSLHAQIVLEVKEAGACRYSKNNRKLVTVVWTTDLATQSAVGEAADAATQNYGT